MALAGQGWRVIGSVRHPSESWDLLPPALSWRNANSGAGPERRLDLKHSTRGPQKPPGYFTGCPKVPGRFPKAGCDPGPLASWYASIEKSLALTLEAPGHDRQCSALSDRQACRADAGGLPDEGALRGIRGLGQGERAISTPLGKTRSSFLYMII